MHLQANVFRFRRLSHERRSVYESVPTAEKSRRHEAGARFATDPPEDLTGFQAFKFSASMDRRGCQDQFAGMVVNTPPVKRSPITPNDERSSDSTLRRPVVFSGKGISSSTNRAVELRPGTCTVTVLLPRVSR